MFAVLIIIIDIVIHQEFSFKIDDQSFSEGGVCFWLSVCLIMSGTTSDQTLNNICNSRGNGKCRINKPFFWFQRQITRPNHFVVNTRAVSAVSPVRLSGLETESLGHDEVSKWNISGSNHKLSQSQRMMHFETLQPFLSGVSLSCLCVPLIQF